MNAKELKYKNYPAYLRNRYHAKLLKRLKRRYMLDKLSVLDVGGGGGAFSYFLDEDFAYTTLDIDKERVDDALSKRIPALHYDGQTIPIDDSFFDVVLCSHTIEHVPAKDRVRLLREMKRVARHAVLIVFPKEPHPLEKKALRILEKKGRRDLFVYENIKEHLSLPAVSQKTISNVYENVVWRETSNPHVWMTMSIYLRTWIPDFLRVPVTFALDPLMRWFDRMKPATTWVAFFQH